MRNFGEIIIELQKYSVFSWLTLFGFLIMIQIGILLRFYLRFEAITSIEVLVHCESTITTQLLVYSKGRHSNSTLTSSLEFNPVSVCNQLLLPVNLCLSRVLKSLS